MRRLLVLPALAALTFALPSFAATPVAAPQVVDPKGDANGSANAVYDQAGPAGNQDYADVTSILWKTTTKTTKVKKKTVTTVTGFAVTVTLAGPPTAPNGTEVVYRALGTPPCPGGGSSAFFGVVYYTQPDANNSNPQSALRDNCTGATRLTPIALPVIAGNTITWTVPLSVIPADTKVKVGTTLSGLWFETREIENFPKGACFPAQVPTYGGSCGLGAGALDNSKVGTAAYTLK
jgi:hypothetical protein